MALRRGAALMLAAVGAASMTVGAQQRFKAGVDLVHFSVVVTDKQGSPITGLQPSDFELLEEGKPQSISYFTEGDPDDKPAEVLPLRLGLALDTSGSMDRDIVDVRTGAIKFLRADEPWQRVGKMRVIPDGFAAAATGN